MYLNDTLKGMIDQFFVDTASGDQLDRMAMSVANQEFRTEIGTKRHEECNHKWKFYYGLIDSFEYCTKCDIKK